MLKIDGAVARIEFYNSKANSLSLESLKQIKSAIEQASNDSSVRIIILQSGGDKAFCGGASFDEMRALESKASASSFFYGFAEVMLGMISCPKPVIVRAQGAAVGGGVGLIAAADYVFASESATVKLSELAIGLGAMVIEPFVTAKVGSGNFLNMSLDCEARSAEWCVCNGLFSRTAASLSELDDLINEKVKIFSNFRAEAFSLIKSESWKRHNISSATLRERADMSGALALSAKIPI